MADSLKELCRLATKYALCPEMAEPSLAELKKRFAGFDWCKDKATAAAFGYYAAMEEFNGKKTITKSIHEQCTLVVDDALAEKIDALEATDRMLTLVCRWLREEMSQEEWSLFDGLFEPFLINEDFIEKYIEE
jgi:hypothetical protein